jgi:hypothetical protein
MATNSLEDSVEVFKFIGSGVLALCEEVVAEAQPGGYLDRMGVDLDHGWLETNFEQGVHKAVFPRKDEQ